MKKSTIGELLDGELDARGYRLYVVRDGDTVFYVGQSDDIASRLWEHLGVSARGLPTSKSHLGRVVIDNAPGSRRWQIELYTVDELDVNGVDLAEEALIAILRPCLNRALNPNPSALPDKYVNRDAQERAQSRAVFAVFGEQEKG